MHEFYKSPQVFPLIGLSHHNTIVVSPACKVKKAKSIFVYKRDLRQSRKEAMGRFWSTMVHDLCSNTNLQSYDEQVL